MEQLTTEQAIAFHDSGAWKQMDAHQLAAFQLRQDRLCVPFSKFHEAIGVALGRPVWTHEFGLNRDGLIAEMEGKADAPTFEQIISMLPTNKVIVVATQEN